MNTKLTTISLILLLSGIAAIAAMPTGFLDVSAYSDLQTALDQAIAQDKVGLYIPANHTVTANDTIALPNAFAIVGEDADTSIIYFTAMTDYNGFISSAWSCRDLRFETFTVDASAITPPSGSEHNDKGVFRFTYAKDLIFRNVHVLDAPRMGIILSGSYNLIENCEFLDGNFIKISTSGTHNTITANTINGGTWQGIRANGSNCTITDNTITRLVGGQSFAIFITGLSHSLIQNNTIEYNEHYGIFGKDPDMHNNAIIDNTITGIGIVDEVVLDEAGSGIILWPGAQYNLIQNNTVTACRGYALCVAGSYPSSTDAPGNILSQNIASGSVDPGIVISGASDSLVRKNTSFNHSSSGFHLGDEVTSDVQSPNLKAINNTAYNNMLEGLFLNDIFDGYVMGNVATNNCTGTYSGHQPTAMLITGGSNVTNNTIIGNTLTEPSGTTNQNYGIYIDTAVTGNSFSYNDLYPNSTAGIMDNSSAANTFSNNRLTSDTSVWASCPPLADAGFGDIAIGGGIINLNATATQTKNAAAVSYLWQQIYGSPAIIDTPTAPTTTVQLPDITQYELVGFRVTTTNTFGSTYDEVYYALEPAENLVLPGTTYQTGFDLTDDISGQNYALGTTVGQNDWRAISNYDQSEIKDANTAADFYWGDAYLYMLGYSNAGIAHDSGISKIYPQDPCASIIISMDVAVPAAGGSDRVLELYAGGLGDSKQLLFQWIKGTATNLISSRVLDPGGNVWAGSSSYVNNARWPGYALGTFPDTQPRYTHLQIVLTAEQIHYNSTNYWDDGTYAKDVTHTYSFTESLGDLRNFGDIVFIGVKSGVSVPWYIDNLSIEYAISYPVVCGSPHTVYLPEDFNQDCYVDLNDLAILAQQWQQCTDPQEDNCDAFWK